MTKFSEGDLVSIKPVDDYHTTRTAYRHGYNTEMLMAAQDGVQLVVTRALPERDAVQLNCSKFKRDYIFRIEDLILANLEND